MQPFFLLCSFSLVGCWLMDHYHQWALGLCGQTCLSAAENASSRPSIRSASATGQSNLAFILEYRWRNDEFLETSGQRFSSCASEPQHSVLTCLAATPHSECKTRIVWMGFRNPHLRIRPIYRSIDLSMYVCMYCCHKGKGQALGWFVSYYEEEFQKGQPLREGLLMKRIIRRDSKWTKRDVFI